MALKKELCASMCLLLPMLFVALIRGAYKSCLVNAKEVQEIDLLGI